MKRVLVTGGAGFIGSYVVEALLQRGCTVMSLDCLMPQVHPCSPNWPEYQQALLHDPECLERLLLHFEDVRNPREFPKTLRSFRPDTVIHLAALVGVAQGNHEIAQYVSANVTGTANVLDCVVKYNQEIRENQEQVQRIKEGVEALEAGEARDLYLGRLQPLLDTLAAKPQAPIERVLVAGSMSAYGEGAYALDDAEDLSLAADYVRLPSDWVPGQMLNPGGSLAWDAPGMHPIPTSEDVRLQPASVYAWTKEQQERLEVL